MTRERKLDDLVGTLRNVVARGKKCTLLIGAGCSVKAGIPTAVGFVNEIKERNPPAYDRAAHKTYPHCMAELPPDERRDLIAEFVDRARINWAHIAIAQLMKKGFVDRVLTVNFDPLVIRACALVGEFPAVYDFAASQRFKPDCVPDQAVFYLHGQHSGFRLLHTEQEVKEHSEGLAPVFQDAGRGRMWIVVGYSGENDPVFDHLAAVPQFDNELYWITYQDEEPSSRVRERLLRSDKDNYAFYIKGYDADGFFVKLAQELECFPPDFVGRPFSHLNRMLELVADFDPPGQDAKLRNTAQDWISDAIARYEKGAEPTPSEQDAEHRRIQRSAVAALTQFLAGDYGKASEIAADAPGEETEKLDAWAHFMEGVDLQKKAETKSGAEADRFLVAAIEKYQAALDIKPDLHQALYNWGTALYGQAETKSGAEADRLFVAAGEKYQAALAIKPDMHEALNNWGTALFEQTKTKSGAEADRLFAAAGEKYQAAFDIKPDYQEALNNWGNALLEQARTKSGAEADELFAAAIEKYQAALAIKPDKHEALNNWGSALSDQARTKSGAEADRLFAAAIEKYQAALDIKPDYQEALYNWGTALFEQAETKSGAEADRLFAAASEKYQAALDIKPDLHQALYNWGSALLEQAKTKSGAEADRLFAAAIERYREALDIKPDDHEVLSNWGLALYGQARTKSGAEADELFATAGEKYQAALAIEPDLHQVLNNWGTALSDQAETKSGAETDELFAAAIEKYQAALAIKPDLHQALYNWGTALLEQAKTKNGAEAEELYRLAAEKLSRAEALAPGCAAYNLACLAAVQGREEDAFSWLVKAREAGRLPNRAHLDRDPDFEGIRGGERFQGFLASLSG